MLACCAKAVEVRQSAFHGLYQHVLHLGEALHHDRIRAMLASGELIVSADGRSAASWMFGPSGLIWPCLNGQQLSAAFIGDRPVALWVDGSSVIIFGRLAGENRSAIVRVTTQSIQTLCQADDVLGIQYGPAGPVIFARHRQDEMDICRIVSPGLPDVLHVNMRAIVSGLQDQRLLVLEPIAGMRYRYTVGRGGFEDWYPLPISCSTEITGLGRWRRRYAIGLRTEDHSFVQLFNAPGNGRERVLSVEGILERMWTSPDEKGLAYLVRVSTEGKTVRRLVMNCGVQFEGLFALGAGDLAWSPNGVWCMACIHAGLQGDGPMSLVTHRQNIQAKPGHFFVDFVVGNRGRLDAWIESNGRFRRAIVNSRRHDALEYAWNLRPDGSISYNGVVGDVVMLITDRTHAT
ncbi:hypothetical protein HZA85_03770 [Candidatus Uhrbacteria bacterium]|nr:hypothetical protein [Candidatus Uhrbacteria bacterium]